MGCIKKIFLSFLFILTFSVSVFSLSYSDISSVKYVHSTIKSQKDIDVPIDQSIDANNTNSLRYLLEQIDKANGILNGIPTTYAQTALKNIASKSRVQKDVNELIVKQGKFSFDVSGVNSFNFYISASGNYKIDWGDGKTDTITKTNTTNTNYSHTYAVSGNYKIILTGLATGYNSSETIASISFYSSTNKTKITSIGGDLGSVFPTIVNISPRFYQTFFGCSGLTGSIPENLFAGISGAPVSNMFSGTFNGCKNLTGESAKSDGQYLYEKWPSATTTHVSGCYYIATKLSDYASIPAAWK